MGLAGCRLIFYMAQLSNRRLRHLSCPAVNQIPFVLQCQAHLPTNFPYQIPLAYAYPPHQAPHQADPAVVFAE